MLSTQKPSEKAYPKELLRVGDHIRKRRLDLKLPQKDVAGILGVDTTTVTNWENNGCQPKLYLIPKIVRFLGYTPFSTSGKPALSEEIKAYRLVRGLSLKKLSKALGVDPTTLARWENGRSAPSQRLKKRLVELLGSCADGT